MDCRLEPHLGHCVVLLTAGHIYLWFNLRKTRPDITEKLLTGT